MDSTEARALVAAAVEKGGAAALMNLDPFELVVSQAFDEAGNAIPLALDERCLVAAVRPARLMTAVLHVLGAKEVPSQGPGITYAVSAGQESDPTVLAAILEALPWARIFVSQAGKDIKEELFSTPDEKRVEGIESLCKRNERLEIAATRATWDLSASIKSEAHRRSRVVLTLGLGRLFVRLLEAPSVPTVRLSEPVTDGKYARYLAADGKQAAYPHDLAQFLSAKMEEGWTAALDERDDRAALGSLLASTTSTILVSDVTDAAGVLTGRIGVGAPRRSIAKNWTEQGTGRFLQTVGAVKPVERALRSLDTSGKHIVVTRRARELAAMGEARRAERDGLLPRQDDAVSTYLASERGMLNASDVGCGKTIMTLAAWREAATMADHPFRAVVVCASAGARGQWYAEELPIHFPEAEGIGVYTATDVDEVRAIPVNNPQAPVVVVVTTNLLHAHRDAFLAIEWDEVACDEADFLANPSPMTDTLWQLRRKARRGVALTGTPERRRLDDIAALLSWSRDEEFNIESYVGRTQLDNDDDRLERFRRCVGPTLFRMDSSDVAHLMPKVSPPQIVSVVASPDEMALANGARMHLAAALDRLVLSLEIAGKGKSADEMRALRSARGALLGGIPIARLACAYPAAVGASKSTAALLLEAEGLIKPAAKTGGTKLRVACDLVEDAVANGEQVLVFSDFKEACKPIASELANRGIRVGTYLGGEPARERDDRKRAYAAGDLDVMVISSAGNRALNLQMTRTIVHYDLPWTPGEIVQRIGRARRLYSKHADLRVLIPVVKGTIEERVIAKLLPRAMSLMAALDLARGVDPRTTGLGAALVGLTDGLGDEEASKSNVTSIIDTVRDLLDAA